MSEAVPTQAASSPADAVDVFQGQQPTMSEYSQYRATGEIPERFKPAEEKPTDAQEETAEVAETEESETAPEPDPEEKQQEPPQKVSPAQKRILQLLAEKKDLERKLAATAQTDAKPDSSTVQPSQSAQKQAATYQEWEANFIDAGAPAWIEQWAKDHPDKSYESANAAMNSFMRSVERHYERERSNVEALNRNVTEARAKYADFDEITAPLVSGLTNPNGTPKVAKEVFDAVNKSRYFTELLYVIGGDPKTSAEFIRLANEDPLEAVKQIGWWEGNIRSEFNQQGNAEETQGTKAPVVKKTQAPKPPEPVTGASSRAFDVNDDSLSADDWMRKRNQQIAKRS